jgi:hypothetical protein
MEIANLARLKSCRISFIQSLLTRMIRERWAVRPVRWDLDHEGRGVAIYTIDTPTMLLSFVIFSTKLREDEQEERIVATKWDVMAGLLEGPVDEETVDRLSGEMPLVIDGRMEPNGLMWCRANRSSRVFDHTVDRLASGRQPDIDRVAEAGYLMRTLDFRANGLNGSLPLVAYRSDHPLRGPYFAQMLGCYLVRQFSLDLVEHISSLRTRSASRLRPTIARYFGVGNSSGMGLVLFLLSHPDLIDRWLSVRFSVVAQVRRSSACADVQNARVRRLLARRIRYSREDRTPYPESFASADRIADDLETLAAAALTQPMSVTWDELLNSESSNIHAESSEAINAVLVEAHPEHANALSSSLVVEPDGDHPAPDTRVRILSDVLQREFDWALSIPYESPDERYYIWYKSEENEEPRLAVRGAEVGHDLTVNVVGDAHALSDALASETPDTTLAQFLLRHPELRPMVRRVWMARNMRYHTPHMNSSSRGYSPVDAMRFVLSGLYGVEKMYPLSDRWVRSVMMQGAPTATELAAGADEDWLYPSLADVP